MADTNDYIREKKKYLLRRRIVRGTADAPEPFSGGMEEETQEIEEQLARSAAEVKTVRANLRQSAKNG